MADLMRDQENPDGEFGHNEREDLRDTLDALYPHKQKFTGRGKFIEKEDVATVRKELDYAEMIETLKTQCPNYVYGCSIDSCEHCKKRDLPRRIRKDSLTLEEQGQELIEVENNGTVTFIKQKPARKRSAKPSPNPLESECRNYKLGCTKKTCGWCGKRDRAIVK